MRTSIPSALLVLALAAPAHAQLDVLIKTGDPAPGFDPGYTVSGFAEPPSISDGGYAVFRLTIDGPGSDDPQAIYRWHQTEGLDLVARTGQSVVFVDGSRTITFLQSPIADNEGNVAFTAFLDVGSGLIVWDPGPGMAFLFGAARTGQAVVLTCDTVSGDPCPDVPGQLSTLAAFTNRTAAAFSEGRVFFRAGVTPDAGGSVDAIWTWDVASALLKPIANSRQRADGVPASPANFFQSFTNLANCGGVLWGLANISQEAPKTVYMYSTTGEGHTLMERGWPPDANPRFDFHCAGSSWGYAGSYSTTQNDTDPALRGLWVNTEQYYLNGVTPAPEGVPADFLGLPRGQALILPDESFPASIFAAKLIGGDANGKTGVFYSVGDPIILSFAHELEQYPSGSHRIERIYTAHVNDVFAVFFWQKRANVGGQLTDVVAIAGVLTNTEVLTVGDTIDVGGQSATMTGFRLLGRDFVDTVVTGTGQDGHLSAFNQHNDLVLVIDYNLPAGGQGLAAGLDPRQTVSGSGVFRVAVPPPGGKVLDIDGNGVVDALTDGLLVLRRLFGFSGATLIAGAVGGGCTRCDAPSIEAHITSVFSSLDIDGNGATDALTDGLLVLRRLFGFSGATLITGAVGGGCTRCDAPAIEAYIATLL